MFSLTYVSSATRPFTSRELRELLQHCTENNRRREVTGMLLYKDGNFMQLMEGERPAVQELYARVAADPRHRDLFVLREEDAPERHFPQWTMGFRDLASQTVATPGFDPFLNTSLTADEFGPDPAKAQKLLLMFKKNI